MEDKQTRYRERVASHWGYEGHIVGGDLVRLFSSLKRLNNGNNEELLELVRKMIELQSNGQPIVPRQLKDK
ncbi:hypothetical protein BK699_13175 [Bacillus thuringiensis serovar mexicanensis]|uniref:Uncharacterized protein n=1 Tax=Bacillus thuringiensis serovar mexicanensis TaxID=180868 RepID=A0A242W7C2_BACTU|nr:hypothetical protein BK699_13175 [Bacillus thuringiensis serovar mexicanensis]OTW97780.1 hypothetical protein BK705_28565 [Bacillus thuringiensis serovar monterrey]